VRSEGKVTKWKEDRGFGFVNLGDGMGDVFFHATQLPDGARVEIGGRAKIDGIKQTPKGRAAVAISLVPSGGEE
jgi:cold shock CspA family protein